MPRAAIRGWRNCYARALAEGIPGARYVEPDGAHRVTIQRECEVSQLMREHCAEKLV